MYSTCLFCNADLGRNEVIEHFPVGRRLAFDSARGRLWVVCRRCERWNLSPLEERWEAVEECERAFEGTRLRVSTENVGLARAGEGLELVRIGAPKRPEMAAWRYGDQFGRRRRRAFLQVGLGLGALGAVVAGGMAVGVSIAGGGWWMGRGIVERVIHGSPNKVVARLPVPGRGLEPIKRRELERVRLIGGAGPSDFTLLVQRKRETLEFEGEEAMRAAGALMVPLNRFGGTRSQVQSAVGLLEEVGDPIRFFAATASTRARVSPGKLEYPVRLALEMAAHEEQERRAMEGELATLEAAWRQAEEIAEISDSLLLPESIGDWMRRLRGA
jgi:hypothetical protein